MKLLNYLDADSGNKNSKWLRNGMILQPKPFHELLIDMFVKFVFILIMAAVFYWGTRLLRFIWRLHKNKMRELAALNQMYLENLRDFRYQSGMDNNEGGHPHND